jgi:hypothetical protein
MITDFLVNKPTDIFIGNLYVILFIIYALISFKALVDNGELKFGGFLDIYLEKWAWVSTMFLSLILVLITEKFYYPFSLSMINGCFLTLGLYRKKLASLRTY